ncbi:itaconyl-CoA hydratase [Marinobacterium arenosum]|uniref:itaconyl-CoA hydratase n=1 Tax=Marinobacterium arenosum TaxID=2862496 RepID=UPI001C96F467|nr:itaconyl-CoA hydratase [Marinobacterium arenosum]MBY4678788.1 itaconyl-CoA hydratase [Marinobacterium arenosum]
MDTKSPSSWIGRKEQTLDNISELLCNRLAATFSIQKPKRYDNLPALWHWAFFQNPVSQDCIGPDGHPNISTFIPGIEGLVRMWAGGRVKFIEPLKVGLDAARESSIIKVTEKEGRSGKLIFVTVHHEFYQQGTLCISEEQDIVYRPPVAVKSDTTSFDEEFGWIESINPDPSLLFRYSAVTFNAHRIHYDWPYTTEQESYRDLVVHGPLIATLMMRAFTTANPSLRPTFLAYKGLRPLTAEQSFNVSGRHTEHGKSELWAFNKNGLAHQAELQYRENN